MRNMGKSNVHHSLGCSHGCIQCTCSSRRRCVCVCRDNVLADWVDTVEVIHIKVQNVVAPSMAISHMHQDRHLLWLPINAWCRKLHDLGDELRDVNLPFG